MIFNAATLALTGLTLAQQVNAATVPIGTSW